MIVARLGCHWVRDHPISCGIYLCIYSIWHVLNDKQIHSQWKITAFVLPYVCLCFFYSVSFYFILFFWNGIELRIRIASNKSIFYFDCFHFENISFISIIYTRRIPSFKHTNRNKEKRIHTIMCNGHYDEPIYSTQKRIEEKMENKNCFFSLRQDWK